jgi:hypothetical protein
VNPRRRDLSVWLAAIVAAGGATSIATATGARLGAALTLGTVVLLAIVLVALALEARG